MAEIINLDDVLSMKRTFSYQGKNYEVVFSDDFQRRLTDTMLKASQLATKLNGDNTDWDKESDESQREIVEDAYSKQHKLVMDFFNHELGEENALQLYNDLNQSTQGLLFVMGLMNRTAGKVLDDAREALYPSFDGNEDDA